MRYTCTHTVEDTITDNNGTRIKVIATYGINDDRISVTGEVYYERQDNDGFFFDNEPDDCGMVHDRILQAFPWLRQLIDLHLSDARTGAPMYALDNGWYWLREDDPNDRYNAIITDKSRRRAAQYLRTTPCMLKDIETKENLARLIETTLAPAWEKQVNSALALYGLLSPYAPKLNKNLDSMHIVYTDEQKRLYEQPLSDLPDVGTLIDPDTGDDMEIIGYKLV
jgi:hypothetical protein